jgi:hypothetical protein
VASTRSRPAIIDTSIYLQRLRQRHGFTAPKLRDLHFDALIALTARATGALLITCNRDDFVLLQKEEPFELEIWN